MAAVAILIVVTASASLTKIWNFDVFWHLASGQWMLEHKQVLRTDPFSCEASGQWVNIHWLFQVLIAALHAAGGFEVLSVFKCAVSVTMVAVFAAALRKRIPPGWLIFSGLAMLAVLAERIRVRPELITCLFVTITVLLVERVRQGGSPNCLWLLVPIVLVWVNMHGLYVLGMAVIWSAVVGSLLDRKLRAAPIEPAGKRPQALLSQRALGPILFATVMSLVTPWPVEAATHPLLLWTRVSGEAIVYTYGVAELQPTWEALTQHAEAVTVVCLIVALMLANRRTLPVAHVLWLMGFAFIGMLARRNVGLIAPVCGYLLAWHGGALLNRLAKRGRRWRRTGRAMTWVAAAAGALLAFAYATELVHRIKNSTERLGVGLLEQNYPLGNAVFLRDLDADGAVFCENFGDAAVFIYHSTPRRKVWMDGRLEVHSHHRFAEQNRIRADLRTEPSATWGKLPDDLRFLIIQHHSSEMLSSMMESRRFQLIHLDPTAACFVRRDWRGPAARPGDVDPAAIRPNLADFDRPLTREVLVDGYPAERRRWYRQNPAPRTYWMGAMMLWLGKLDSSEAASSDPLQQRCTLLSVRYLTAAVTEGLVPPDISTGMLAWAHHQRAGQLPLTVDDDLPVNVHLARALWLYSRLDPRDLRTETLRAFAYRNVHALVQGHQFDAADAAVAEMLTHLPPGLRISPPDEYLRIRGTIAQKLAAAQSVIDTHGVTALPPRTRALAMVHKSIGMIDRAIEQLTRAPPATRQLLGDLLLRRGRPGRAREVYKSLLPASAGEDDWRIRMRLALCDWVEGKLFASGDALQSIAAPDRPAVLYYQAILLEQLGLYDAALSAAGAVGSADEKMLALLKRARGRITRYPRKRR